MKYRIQYLIVALALATLLLGVALLSACQREPQVVVPLAANFSNPIDIEGSSSAAAPALTFEDDTDSGIFRSAADTINIATGGTERLEIDSSAFTIVPELEATGGQDLQGAKLDLDADGDTSITADTDDQVDFELGGADLFVLKDWGASNITTDTTEYLFEIADSTPIITAGTVSLAGLNIDLGIGNSTGGTNSVYGILVDGITADAQNTETAIAIGSGWDRGIDLDGTDLYMDDDQDTYFHESGDDVVDFVAGAAAGDLRIHTGNLRVGDGSADLTLDGDDAYVQGFLEVDGELELDGALDADSTANFADTVTFAGGLMLPAADATAAFTATAANCGKTYFLNAATEFQTVLPPISTVSAGCSFQFICKAAPASASYTIITGNSTEDILIGGINELEVDTNDDGPYDASADTITFVDGTAVVGDYVYLISDGTSWYVRGQANADGGITITDSD